MINQQEFISFLLGAIAGVEGFVGGKAIWERFGPRNTPDQFDDMADELRATSKRMSALADICDRLANGEDPETMDMPDDIRTSYNDWRNQ